MRKGILIIMMLILTCGLAMGQVEESVDGEVDVSSLPDDIELTVSENLVKPSLITLSFLDDEDITTADVQTGNFIRTSSHGAFGKVCIGGVSCTTGQNAIAGKSCDAGEYVRVYEMQYLDGQWRFKRELFQHVWWKVIDGVNVHFSDWWTKDLNNWYYGYSCYKSIDTTPEGFEFECSDSTVFDLNDAGVGATYCEDGCIRTRQLYAFPPDPVAIKTDFCVVDRVIDVPGSGEGEPTGQAGTLSGVQAPVKARPGEKLSALATFKADVDGKYYLEAGMTSTYRPLSIIATASECDGNPNWAGAFVDMKAGETIDLMFIFDAQDDEGVYSVPVGVYTGCLADGGEEIAKKVITTRVASPTKITVGSARFSFIPIIIIVVSVVLLIIPNPITMVLGGIGIIIGLISLALQFL